MADPTNNFVRLLTALCSGVQSAEDALQQLLTQRSLGTAVGAQLDVLGAIVGQPRQGLSDDDYTRYIRARIATDRSNGLINELLNITSLILNDPAATLTLTQEGVATARLTIGGIAITDALGDIVSSFVQTAASAGVRILVEWLPLGPAGTFTFDTGPGFDVGGWAGDEG